MRPAAVHPRLVMLQGPDIGRQIELLDQPIVIGRGEDADLRIDSDLVSRRHAVIERLHTHYVLRDEGSTNGTFVGGERVDYKRLSEGDLIKIGK
jgi:pSer/pThr/pTyr-binding forkhead associated (FHA) protein